MKYVLKRLFGEEFNNLLLLNLLTVGLCIPVVTAGPAILAMKGTLVKILDDRCDLRRIHEFWGLFKKKFWKGLLFEVLFILYGMMLLWCKSLADNVGGSAGRPLRYAAALGGLLACIVSVCAVTILASVQMPVSQAMWNALCLAIGRLPRSLASAVCVFGLAYAAFLLYPYSLLFARSVQLFDIISGRHTGKSVFVRLDDLVIRSRQLRFQPLNLGLDFFGAVLFDCPFEHNPLSRIVVNGDGSLKFLSLRLRSTFVVRLETIGQKLGDQVGILFRSAGGNEHPIF